MVNQHLLSYISKNLNQGTKAEPIVRKLIEAGWAQADIIAGFQAAGRPLSQEQLLNLGILDHQSEGSLPEAGQITDTMTQTAAKPALTTAQPKVEALDKIPSVSDLFKETLEKFKQGWLKLIIITLLPAIATMLITLPLIFIFGISVITSLSAVAAAQHILGILTALQNSLVIIIPAAVIFLLILTVVQLWIQLALVYLVKDPASISLKEAFEQTKNRIFKFWWLGLLQSLIVIGGIFALILPGLVMAFWFSLGTFILVHENQGGLKALLKSREYIRDQGWEIFVRLLAAAGLAAVVLMGLDIFENIIGKNIVLDLVNLTWNLIIGPAMTLYGYLIYHYARRTKTDMVFEPKAKQKTIYKLWAVFGLLGMVFMTLGVVVLIRQAVQNFEQFGDELWYKGDFDHESEFDSMFDAEFNLDADLEYKLENPR